LFQVFLLIENLEVLPMTPQRKKRGFELL